MMRRRRKPRCFVAMAFDQPDTDQLYDKAIRPVLRRNGVVPVIINRREDNRDINHQIIEQLNSCDFCIADLTYTRPSVYYEAGYAQREVEVIYTVRADHLLKNQAEDRRVHFDLQMKPLIKWKDPTDSAFPKKLERRLKSTVLKEIARKAKEDEKLKVEKEKFSSLPINKRLEVLRRKSINAFRNIGFNDWVIRRHMLSLRSLASSSRHYKNPSKYAYRDLLFIAERKRKKKKIVVCITSSEKVALKKMKEIGAMVLPSYSYSSPYYLSRELDPQLHKVDTTEEHHLVLTLNNTPATRVMSAMPYLSLEKQANRYVVEKLYEDEVSNEPLVRISRHIHFYFLSKIESETQLREYLEEVINNI